MSPSVTSGVLPLQESLSLKNKLSLLAPLPHLLTRSSVLKRHTREGRWAGQTCPHGHAKLLGNIFLFNIFHQELMIGSALGEGSIQLL